MHALELDPESGGFRFDTVVVLVARQNGKTRWLLGLALWRLYLDGARLVLSTAQDLEKAEALLAEGADLVDERPALKAELRRHRVSTGQHRIQFKDSRLWRVQSASGRSGRSYSADLVMMDELREHRDNETWNAMHPTTAARARGMVVAASNAGDKKSVVLRRLRDKSLQRITLSQTEDTRTFHAEWSAPEGCEVLDRAGWVAANPSMGW
ncbi:MAG: terminase large subunit, partial [Brachybacterium sp.]|nr:terminase large subunit [Brachybacterium sp.]